MTDTLLHSILRTFTAFQLPNPHFDLSRISLNMKQQIRAPLDIGRLNHSF